MLADKLLEALQTAGPEGSVAVYENDPDTGLIFKVRWFDPEGATVCSISCQFDQPNFIFDTIIVPEENRQNGMLKDMCRIIPKFCRENDFEAVFVPSITSPVVRDVLSNNGFEQNESGNWIADISDPANPVEAYGNS